MGRAPCCDEIGVKKGPWTTEEDTQLMDYIEKNGHGSWRQLPKLAGLNRCGKSCRLRWTNYLRPDIKRGKFSEEEDRLIIHLHSVLGNKWSQMANQLPGRTDNEIKNYWNTNLKKKLLQMGIDPVTHRPRSDLNLLARLPNYLLAAAASIGSVDLTGASWNHNSALRLQADAAYLARLQLLQGLLQVITPPNIDSTSLLGYSGASLGDYDQFKGLHELQSVALHNPTTMPSGYFNSSFGEVPTNFQACPDSSLSIDGGCSSANGSVESNTGGSSASYYINPSTSSSTPALVSASPENATTDQSIEPIISTNLLVQSPNFEGWEQWEGLNLDGLDKDLSWKSILDDISWSDEL